MLRSFAALALVAGAALLAQPGSPAVAGELLDNGGFEEAAADGRPLRWAAVGGDLTRVAAPVAEGSYAGHLAADGAASVNQAQIPVVGGSTYTFAGKVRFAPPLRVQLQVVWKNWQGQVLRWDSSLPLQSAPEYQALSTTRVAPAAAVSADLAVVATPDAEPFLYDLYVDAFSFQGTSPAEVSPTPTWTPPPAPPTSTVTPAPDSPTPEPSPESPTPEPSPPASPTPEVPDDGSGGMLRNGGFERVDGGLPADWRKYGGTLSSISGPVHGGERAALLESDTDSTKWIYQAAPVAAGDWYAIRAWVQVEGAAQAFLRLSWYASPDGSGESVAANDSPLVDGPTGGFVPLATGPAQAPEGAASVRARVMLRPAGAAPIRLYVDDARLDPTAPPPPGVTPAPTVVERGPEAAPSEVEAETRGGAASRSRPGPQATAAGPTPSTPLPTATLFSEVSSIGRRPSPAPEADPPPQSGGGRPWLWPLVAGTVGVAAGAGGGVYLYRRRRA